MQDHREYFWDVVQFKVENTRFQLPAYRFVEESQYFATQFKLSSASPNNGHATTIVDLPNVSVGEFETFLKILLPRSPDKAHPSLSLPQWTSVLKLSTQWQFKNIRKTAIAAIQATKPKPIELAELAKEFRVPTWLLEGYEGLIKEEIVLEGSGRTWTDAEIEKIGSKVVIELQRIALARYRGMLRKATLGLIQSQILDSPFLKGEYEAMKKEAATYLTPADIKEEAAKEAKATQCVGYSAFSGTGAPSTTSPPGLSAFGFGAPNSVSQTLSAFGRL